MRSQLLQLLSFRPHQPTLPVLIPLVFTCSSFNFLYIAKFFVSGLLQVSVGATNDVQYFSTNHISFNYPVHDIYQPTIPLVVFYTWSYSEPCINSLVS